jgi:hypothetical protein
MPMAVIENTFGKHEMDKAAEAIVNRVVSENDWRTPLSVLDFDTEMLRRGFECLVGYGWLKFVDDGGQPYYRVKFGFYKRFKIHYPFEKVPEWTSRKKG